jgi:beta-galactosidase
LKLDDREIPLLAGELHYFQHPPETWPKLLDGMAGLGFEQVSTYVPWGLHQIEPDRFDFGEQQGRLDIDRFLDLATERSLGVILRPGPHVNAELTWLGYPRQILEEPEIMARSPQGNPVWLPIAPRPFPLPSYASERFLEAADRWLEAVGARLAPRQWPEGALILVQLDNEAPLIFRDGPYDQDYHPSAIASFRSFTAARGRPQKAPPTRLEATTPDDLLPTLDWVACKHEIFADALRRFRRSLERGGLDRIATSHNLAQAGTVPPVAPSTFDAADLVGFDFYHHRHQLELVRSRCLYAAGTTDLPFAAELGWGGPWNLPLRTLEDDETQTLAALAFGIRGVSVFMAADRDRYYGAPLDRRGRRQYPAAPRLEKLIRLFRDQELHHLRLVAPVAVVIPRLYPELSRATWTLGPCFPPALEALGLRPIHGASEATFGFAEPIQIAWAEALNRLTLALGCRGLGHTIVDGATASRRLEQLRPEVVVLPTYECIDRKLWRDLLARVDTGLTLIVGPRAPELGEDMRPLDDRLELVAEAPLTRGAGEIRLVPLDSAPGIDGLADWLASQSGLTGAFRPASPSEKVVVSALARDGKTKIICVANLSGDTRLAHLTHDLGLELRDLMTRTKVDPGAIELDPFGVRLLGVEVIS